MPYDLHIVRSEDWTDAASDPITKQHVDALIATDSELAWSTTDYVDMRDEGEVLTRYFMIQWRGEPCFWWYRDEIRCSRPNEAQMSKLVQMARVLNARVVGDDGEVYPIEQQAAPRRLSPHRRLQHSGRSGNGCSPLFCSAAPCLG